MKALPVIEWLLSGLDTLLKTSAGDSPLWSVAADLVAVVKQIVADWKDGKLTKAEFAVEKGKITVLLNDASALPIPAPGPEILKVLRDVWITVANAIENHIPA